MSPSVLLWARLRQCVFAALVALCLLGLFIVRCRPDITIPPFDIQMFARAEGAERLAPPVLSERKPNQAADDDAAIIVLIWMWPFGVKFDLGCAALGVTGCRLTDDKALYGRAHGVLFHHRDVAGDLGNMPAGPRPWFQKWVWSNSESPANTIPIPELNHLFNLTSNYRRDSDIPVPYGSLVPVTDGDPGFKLPAKDKLVCWVVSNWKPAFKRVQVYAELSNHVEIDIYGRAFDRPVDNEDLPRLISSCKFYLSFENSIYEDYITEKLYNPLRVGTVPVVLGPPRRNYEDYIPGGSFIHVDDFSGVKQLAERLRYLDRNPAEYMRYFDWRGKFTAKTAGLGWYSACRTCHYLQQHRGYQAFHNLNKWYWGDKGDEGLDGTVGLG